MSARAQHGNKGRWLPKRRYPSSSCLHYLYNNILRMFNTSEENRLGYNDVTCRLAQGC